MALVHDAAVQFATPGELVSFAHAALFSPALSTLHAAFLDPDLERTLAEALSGQEGIGNLPNGFLGRFVDSTANALADMAKKGRDPVLVTRATLRPFLAEAISGVIPNAAVLSYQETAPAKRIATNADRTTTNTTKQLKTHNIKNTKSNKH